MKYGIGKFCMSELIECSLLERFVLTIPFHTIWRAELKLKTTSSVTPQTPIQQQSNTNSSVTASFSNNSAGTSSLSATGSMSLPSSHSGGNLSPRFLEGLSKKGRFILRIMTADFRVVYVLYWLELTLLIVSYLHKDEESNDLMTIRDAIGKGIILPESTKVKPLKKVTIASSFFLILRILPAICLSFTKDLMS